MQLKKHYLLYIIFIWLILFIVYSSCGNSTSEPTYVTTIVPFKTTISLTYTYIAYFTTISSFTNISNYTYISYFSTVSNYTQISTFSTVSLYTYISSFSTVTQYTIPSTIQAETSHTQPSAYGSLNNPKIIDINYFPVYYTDSDTTVDGPSDIFNIYGTYSSLSYVGPEVIYKFWVDTTFDIDAHLSGMTGTAINGSTDIDIQLLSAPTSSALIIRNDVEITKTNLPAGTYYLTADTYCITGTEYIGNYFLDVFIAPSIKLGSANNPIPIPQALHINPISTSNLPFVYVNVNNTDDNVSDIFDTYYGYSVDESGPEIIYGFITTIPIHYKAAITFEADASNALAGGVDIDLQLLTSLNSSGSQALNVVTRNDLTIGVVNLPAGTYYLTCDSYYSTTYARVLSGLYEVTMSFSLP